MTRPAGMVPSTGLPPVASQAWLAEAQDNALSRFEAVMARMHRDNSATTPNTNDVPTNLCANCGMENSGERKYCVECGSLLNPSRFLLAREATSHVEKGIRHLRAEHLTEAREELTQALVLDDKNAEAHKNLGKTLARLGDTVRAEEELRLASSLSPQDIESLVELSHLLRRTGRKAEALDCYRAAQTLVPDMPEALRGLARLGASQ